MKIIKLSDLNLLDVGHTIQLWGAIYEGPSGFYFLPLPDEETLDFAIGPEDYHLLTMDNTEWEVFLKQSDVLDIQGPAKAILRKSQRQIDQNISWAVYRRDGYACVYCCRDDVPLTVDHIILWEEGGATTEDNLLTACRRCNKLRGSMQFEEWLDSRAFMSVRPALLDIAMFDGIVADLPRLRGLTTKKQRSR